MTINEAISLLKQYIDYNNADIPDFYTMAEACEVAIKALEQQPTDAVDRVTIKEYLDSFGKNRNVTATDAVDRQEAINAAIEGADKWDGGFNREREKCIQEEIEKLPSVTPKQKMGKWKAFTHSAYRGNDEDGEPIWREVTVYHCDLCNRRTVIKEKFCPNCGRKMQGVEE